MRPLEAVLLAMVSVAAIARWLHPRTRQTTGSLLGMMVILFALHVYFDGLRWEMIPTYALALITGAVLVGDIRRIATARTGESAKWRAVPSPATRAVRGVALFLTLVIALVLPGWLFPRVNFPLPDGLYDVGRLEVFWTDSTREELLTPEASDRRGVWVTFWYPAERPSGRALRYHPQGRRLAADFGASQGLPGFVFWNLTLARTHATHAPQFAVRQGRGPVLLFSHGYGGSRAQNTFQFETLASHGYIVASVEHPYTSIGTVLPNGEPAPPRGLEYVMNEQGRSELLETWTRDMMFVLDRLHAMPVGDLSDSLSGHLQLDRVGAFGHSLGGITAADVMTRDPRVRAGINMDGDPYGRALDRGVNGPFLVFSSRAMDADTVSEALLEFYGVTRDSLDRMFAARDEHIAALLQRGGTEFRMDGAAHFNFTDVPLWSPVLARRGGLAGADPIEAVHEAITTLTLRFFDQYLLGRTRDTNVQLPGNVQIRTIRHEAKGN